MGQEITFNSKHLDYCRRSGDKSIAKDNYIENEYGFMSWVIEDEAVVAVQVYGDGVYWKQRLTDIAKENGCSKIMFHTQRNPQAWVRKYNAKIVHSLMMIEVG